MPSLIACIACFLGGVVSVGIFFLIMVIVDVAWFLYSYNKGKKVGDNVVALIKCIIAIAGCLVFGIQRFIIQDWLLVGLAVIVLGFLAYCAFKLSLSINSRSV